MPSLSPSIGESLAGRSKNSPIEKAVCDRRHIIIKKLRHQVITFTRNVFLCHSPSSHRGITRDKTVPHLSTLRLKGFFLNAGPTPRKGRRRAEPEDKTSTIRDHSELGTGSTAFFFPTQAAFQADQGASTQF